MASHSSFVLKYDVPIAIKSSRKEDTKYSPKLCKFVYMCQCIGDYICIGYLIAFNTYFTNFVKIAGAGDHPKGSPTAS